MTANVRAAIRPVVPAPRTKPHNKAQNSPESLVAGKLEGSISFGACLVFSSILPVYSATRSLEPGRETKSQRWRGNGSLPHARRGRRSFLAQQPAQPFFC